MSTPNAAKMLDSGVEPGHDGWPLATCTSCWRRFFADELEATAVAWCELCISHDSTTLACKSQTVSAAQSGDLGTCCVCSLERDDAVLAVAPCGCAYHPDCFAVYALLEGCPPTEIPCHGHDQPFDLDFVFEFLPTHLLSQLTPKPKSSGPPLLTPDPCSIHDRRMPAPTTAEATISTHRKLFESSVVTVAPRGRSRFREGEEASPSQVCPDHVGDMFPLSRTAPALLPAQASGSKPTESPEGEAKPELAARLFPRSLSPEPFAQPGGPPYDGQLQKQHILAGPPPAEEDRPAAMHVCWREYHLAPALARAELDMGKVRDGVAGETSTHVFLSGDAVQFADCEANSEAMGSGVAQGRARGQMQGQAQCHRQGQVQVREVVAVDTSNDQLEDAMLERLQSAARIVVSGMIPQSPKNYNIGDGPVPVIAWAGFDQAEARPPEAPFSPIVPSRFLHAQAGVLPLPLHQVGPRSRSLSAEITPERNEGRAPEGDSPFIRGHLHDAGSGLEQPASPRGLVASGPIDPQQQSCHGSWLPEERLRPRLLPLLSEEGPRVQSLSPEGSPRPRSISAVEIPHPRSKSPADGQVSPQHLRSHSLEDKRVFRSMSAGDRRLVSPEEQPRLRSMSPKERPHGSSMRESAAEAVAEAEVQSRIMFAIRQLNVEAAAQAEEDRLAVEAAGKAEEERLAAEAAAKEEQDEQPIIYGRRVFHIQPRKVVPRGPLMRDGAGMPISREPERKAVVPVFHVKPRKAVPRGPLMSALREAEQTVCGLCYERLLPAEARGSACGHLFCVPCLSTYAKLWTFTDQVSCPNVKCSMTLPRSMLLRLQGKELVLDTPRDRGAASSSNHPDSRAAAAAASSSSSSSSGPLAQQDPVPQPVPMFNCPICLEEHAAKHGTELYCQHCFCEDCFRGHLESKICDGKVAEDELVCPMPECTKGISVSQVESATRGTILWDKFLQFRMNLWKPDGDEFMVDCPVPGCDARFLATPDVYNMSFVECTSCSTEFCVKCRKGRHDGMPCERFADILRSSTDTDLSFERLMAEEQWKRCPVCGVPSERMSGCNFMKCVSTECRRGGNCTFWCYICAKQLNKDQHYSHFPDGPFEDECDGRLDPPSGSASSGGNAPSPPPSPPLTPPPPPQRIAKGQPLNHALILNDDVGAANIEEWAEDVVQLQRDALAEANLERLQAMAEANLERLHARVGRLRRPASAPQQRIPSPQNAERVPEEPRLRLAEKLPAGQRRSASPLHKGDCRMHGWMCGRGPACPGRRR